MDGVKLFPYCLERSTNVPKDALKAIECPELPEAAEAYRAAAAQLQTVGEEGIKTLEHAYSLCQNPDILKAKRKMMGGKTVTNGDKFAGGEYEDLINRYNRKVEETLRAEGKYRILFAECLDRNRDDLKQPESDDPAEYISIRYSVEKWIAELLISIYGYEKAEKYMEAVNRSPELCLRTNLLKTDRESLMAELADQGFEVWPSDISERALIVSGTGILETEAFREGKFAVQDQASVLAADTLDAKSGMTVADCCAAPGGKTAAIAESMGDQGEIFAFDIYEHKLRLMDELFRRNGISIVKATMGDAREHIPGLTDKCDRVLCDVPCSGLGVLGRKPEIKYRKEYDISELTGIQKQIIDNVSKYVKAGGVLVYSTCTVDPAENTEVVEYFLKNHPGFQKEKEICLNPVDTGTDGFYICKLIREA